MGLSISYICPFFNEIRVMEEALSSILKQRPAGEIIIVDDLSTDGTFEKVKEVLFSQPHNGHKIKLHRNEKRMGAAHSKNLATREATGDIIAVCDADIYKKNRGEIVLDFFKGNPGKGVFYSSVEIEYLDKPEKNLIRIAKLWDGKSQLNFCGITVAYRRELGLKFPYREISINTCCFEAFFLELFKQGVEFGFSNEVTAKWLRHSCNRDKDAAKEIRRKLYSEYGVEVSL